MEEMNALMVQVYGHDMYIGGVRGLECARDALDGVLALRIQDAVPMQLALARFLGLCVLLYPIAICFRCCLPKGVIKHIWSIIGGMLSIVYVFPEATFDPSPSPLMHSIIMATTSFMLLKILPIRVASFATLFYCLAHLLFVQFRQTQAVGHLMLEGKTFGFECILMIMTIKCIGVPFDVSRKEVASPSILTYFAFLYFPFSVIAGPSHQIEDYTNATVKDLPPIPFKHALRCLFVGIFCVLPEVLVGTETLKRFADNDPEIILAPLELLWLIVISGTCYRFGYYFVWTTSEGSGALAGMGYYTPKEVHDLQSRGWLPKPSGFFGFILHGDVKWTKTACSNMEAVELGGPINQRLNGWNRVTQRFLRRNIYKELPRMFSLNLFGTFLFSAVWHGVWPGYFMGFGSLALCIVAERIIRARLSVHAPKSPILRKFVMFLAWLASTVVMCYTMMPFKLLSYERTTRLWSYLGYCFHVTAVAVIVLNFVVELVLPSKKKVDKNPLPIPQKDKAQ